MRIIAAALAFAFAGLLPHTAQADPYRWCAEYGGGGTGGGATNCYFLTLQQCQWQISGAGGFCRENLFYDGRPVTTPGEGVAPRRKKRHHA